MGAAGMQLAPGTRTARLSPSIMMPLIAARSKVTKAVLLPFSAAQGAPVKFYSVVDYFHYIIFFPTRLEIHCFLS